jgi:hypothetical protein
MIQAAKFDAPRLPQDRFQFVKGEPEVGRRLAASHAAISRSNPREPSVGREFPIESGGSPTATCRKSGRRRAASRAMIPPTLKPKMREAQAFLTRLSTSPRLTPIA